MTMTAQEFAESHPLHPIVAYKQFNRAYAIADSPTTTINVNPADIYVKALAVCTQRRYDFVLDNILPSINYKTLPSPVNLWILKLVWNLPQLTIISSGSIWGRVLWGLFSWGTPPNTLPLPPDSMAKIANWDVSHKYGLVFSIPTIKKKLALLAGIPYSQISVTCDGIDKLKLNITTPRTPDSEYLVQIFPYLSFPLGITTNLQLT